MILTPCFRSMIFKPGFFFLASHSEGLEVIWCKYRIIWRVEYVNVYLKTYIHYKNLKRPQYTGPLFSRNTTLFASDDKAPKGWWENSTNTSVVKVGYYKNLQILLEKNGFSLVFLKDWYIHETSTLQGHGKSALLTPQQQHEFGDIVWALLSPSEWRSD